MSKTRMNTKMGDWVVGTLVRDRKDPKQSIGFTWTVPCSYGNISPNQSVTVYIVDGPDRLSERTSVADDLEDIRPVTADELIDEVFPTDGRLVYSKSAGSIGSITKNLDKHTSTRDDISVFTGETVVDVPRSHLAPLEVGSVIWDGHNPDKVYRVVTIKNPRGTARLSVVNLNDRTSKVIRIDYTNTMVCQMDYPNQPLIVKDDTVKIPGHPDSLWTVERVFVEKGVAWASVSIDGKEQYDPVRLEELIFVEHPTNSAPNVNICHDYNGVISFTDEDCEVLYNTDRKTLLAALELFAKAEQLVSSDK